MDATLTLDCVSLNEPFATALVLGHKTEESRNGSIFRECGGRLIGVRSGGQKWDASRGTPTFDPSLALPSKGDRTIMGVVRMGETRPKGQLAAEYGEDAVSAAVGLPFARVGANCTEVTKGQLGRATVWSASPIERRCSEKVRRW